MAMRPDCGEVAEAAAGDEVSPIMPLNMAF